MSINDHQYQDTFRLFFWGYVEIQEYKNNKQPIAELNNEIILVISEIKPKLCRHVIENFDKKVDVCRVARGGLIPY